MGEGISLFVDGLEDRASYSQVRRLFERYGKLRSVSRTRRVGRSSKFGFVHFWSKKEGVEAMRALDRKRWYRSFLVINPARYPRRSNNRNKGPQKVENVTRRRKGKQVWKRKDQLEQYRTTVKNNPKIKKVWRIKKSQGSQNLDPQAGTESSMHMVKVGLNPSLTRLAVVKTR
ncbi:uncharacterized protein LOC130719559 [Lotus japonicus]|uniref:uncharacterized protein LOC130719559 n=1 Tax=Lotus japonicus TaxID=34305 RepID=UPI00258E8BF1|nr:uncharacterized protein LOC130719559 [Lotus japonicus]